MRKISFIPLIPVLFVNIGCTKSYICESNIKSKECEIEHEARDRDIFLNPFKYRLSNETCSVDKFRINCK
jgi:hypothetical protein